MAQEKAAEIIDFNAQREAVGVDEAPSAGAFLASVRQAAGFSLFAVSDATKVKIEHLEAIEANDRGSLPIAAYAIGFVKSYARFLELDEGEIASKFKKDIGATDVLSSAAVPQIADSTNATPDISDGARMVSIFGIMAILVFAFWIIFQVSNSPANRGATGATSAPEQRVRLGTAPLPTLTPRQSTRQVAEENAAEVVIKKDTPVENSAEQNNTAPEVVPNNPVALAPADNNAVNDNVSAATTSITEEEIGFGTAAETLTADNDPVDLSAADESIAADQVVLQSIDTAGALPIIDAPVAEELSAAAMPPITQPRTRIEQIIPEPVIVEAMLLRSIAPQYPNRCARNAAELERVTVLFDVTVQGRPANLRVADTSNSCFDSAAISTLRRWRFDPKTVDGAARADLGKRATLNFRR